MDARGRSGGLALLWEKDVIISLLSQSLHHIDIEVQLSRDEVPWRFTAIYGWPKTHLKWKTCALIYDLKRASSLPWLVGGDVNEIFYNYEKKGGPVKCQSILNKFRGTVAEYELLDLGYNGYYFT